MSLPMAAVGYRIIVIDQYYITITSNVRWSSQTGELTRDQLAFSGFESSSDYNFCKMNRI